MDKKEELVQVDNYATIIAADLARSKLEMSGIHSEVFDGGHASVNWLHTAAIGGIRLMVRSEDLENAREILKTESDVEEAVVTDEEEIDYDEGIYCPACHSKALDQMPLADQPGHGMVDALVNKLFGYKIKYTCRECGSAWRA